MKKIPENKEESFSKEVVDLMISIIGVSAFLILVSSLVVFLKENHEQSAQIGEILLGTWGVVSLIVVGSYLSDLSDSQKKDN